MITMTACPQCCGAGGSWQHDCCGCRWSCCWRCGGSGRVPLYRPVCIPVPVCQPQPRITMSARRDLAHARG